MLKFFRIYGGYSGWGDQVLLRSAQNGQRQEGKGWGAIAEGMLLPRTSCGVGRTTLTGTGTKQLEEETEREECTPFTNGLDPLSTPLTFALGWGS